MSVPIGQALADDQGMIPEDPLTYELRQDIAENAVPEFVRTPTAELPKEARATWVFRTKPGYRNTAIHLRVAQPSGDPDKKKANAEDFKRWASAEFGGGWSKKLEPDKKLYDKYGTLSFKFTPVPREMEAFYATSNKAEADYIRSRLSEPGLSHIYEDVQPFEVEIGGRMVRVLPADDESRQATAEALADAA